MTTICDTGPIVAYLNRRDPHHEWAVALMKQVRAPMLTSEPVLTEVLYFLREDALTVDPVFQLLERGVLQVKFLLSAQFPRARTLMARYDRMDLADASVVVLSEMYRRCTVLTVDHTDFSIYRRNDRQAIDFVSPPDR